MQQTSFHQDFLNKQAQFAAYRINN
ncbi:MAG: hypothetical protein RLZZ86_2217, partial [Cyanobacteriota bacterium]